MAARTVALPLILFSPLYFSLLFVLQEKQRLAIDLNTRLEALASIIVAFGEYVPAAQRTYLPSLLKHIREQAPGNTLVPLELLVQSMQDAGISSSSIRFPAGKHPLEATVGSGGVPTLEAEVIDKLVLPTPSNVHALRAQLGHANQEVLLLKERLREEQRTVEVISARYAAAGMTRVYWRPGLIYFFIFYFLFFYFYFMPWGSFAVCFISLSSFSHSHPTYLLESQVEDARTREESLLNKFTQLSRTLEAMQAMNNLEAQQAAGTTVKVKDVGGLLDKVSVF